MQRDNSRQTKKWIWVLLLAFAGFQIYYVQELLACLLLFSVLFLIGIVGFTVLALAGAGISKLLSFAFSESVLAGDTSGASSKKRLLAIPPLRKWTASLSYGSEWLRQAVQLIVARANRAIS
jgi:hypothetical protein